MPETPSARRTPPYMEAAYELANEIRNGDYDGDGVVFPSETMLAARFGMARGTVRRALKALQDAGLITTRWGKGSTVVPPEQRPGPENG
ncbi:GntR family transcriptional regulator [Kitasatospora sp. NPDC004614]|uniref:GntR family transcriptional regulator n=1 Tax=unclassified Kitasatospora TaxID=2633591 RepID=UPI0036BAA417